MLISKVEKGIKEDKKKRSKNNFLYEIIDCCPYTMDCPYADQTSPSTGRDGILMIILGSCRFPMSDPTFP